MTHLLVSLLIVSAAAIAASEKEPPHAFADVFAVSDWAKKESFGGFHIDVISHDGKEALIVRRSFTTGTPSCDLLVYVKANDQWSEALRLRPYWGDLLEFAEKDGEIVVSLRKQKLEVVRFSFSGLSPLAFNK